MARRRLGSRRFRCPAFAGRVATVIGPAESLARHARSAAFTVASAVLALGAHVAGGGAPPGAVGTTAVLTVSAATASLVGRRPRGLLGNLAVLASVQFLLHELLTVTGAAHGAHAAGATAHAAMGEECPAGAWMLLCHLLSLILTAVLLARGERLAEAVGRALTGVPRLLGALVRPPRPAGLRLTAVPAAVRRPVPALRPLRACAPVVRRGPPVPAC
jgi:hypothetical protein